MDELLETLNSIDQAVKDGCGAFAKFLKAFCVAGDALEYISKNADGPEDNRVAKDALKQIKELLGDA